MRPVSASLKMTAAALAAAALAAACMAAWAADDAAKSDEGAKKPQAIALLDVNYIFQHYPPFADRVAELKSEVQAAEADVATRKKDIENKAAQLKTLDVGSPLHTELSKQVASAQAQLAADVQLQKAAFVRKEALIYADAYDEVEAACQRYAKAHAVGAILRCPDVEVNRNDPQSVLQHLNRPVVWHDGSLDITRIILDAMIESAKSEAPAPGQPPAPPTPEPPASPEQAS